MGLFLTILSAQITGEQIFRAKCAPCHGLKGEGTEKNPEPLFGDKSVEKLVAFIEKKMPEDKPGTVVGEDAQRVAAYVFDAFYSPSARMRAHPPRVELARLTVRQFQNAVADLLATERVPWDETRRGLQAEYFNDRRTRAERGALSRVDPKIDFNFGEGTPAKEITNKEEYAARWTGGLFAPDTGEYELILECENGARLWLNEPPNQQPSAAATIDAWVRSGNDTRHRHAARLLGGRAYPLRLELFKSKKDKTASIALKWKRPRRVEEVIPAECLSPGRFSPVYVVTTAFPPDDRSMGFERGAAVSKAWDEAVTDAALDAAAHLVPRLDSKDRLRELAERAFRRPLRDEEKIFFVDRFAADPKKAVLLILKSPRFLYLDTGSDPFAVASRISFALWDSIPDRALLDAASAGKIDVARHVARMMPDLRTRAKIREFCHQWLNLDRLHDLTKDPKRHADFSEAIVSDLRTSLDLFLDDVIWSDASDFRKLLLADEIYLNGWLAKFYGADPPAGDDDDAFRKVSLHREKFSGILTHPLLMAGFAYSSTSSPIHRGVFIARSLLGRRLNPPPDAVTPESPELRPDLTTRERVAKQTTPKACQSCHAMINPLGFSLEHYDAVGRFRVEEKGKPIQATGAYLPEGGEPIKFVGARELGEFLVRSPESQAAFVQRLFQNVVRQPMVAYGLDTPETLRKYFVQNEFHIRKLIGEMIQIACRIKNK